MANNKVQLANGTVLIDLTDTTATASDVASGSYFYNAAGVKQSGTLVVDQTYSVTKTLTNVTSSNDDTKVIAGNSFYADLTPTSGYAITSITVTMGGVDVTDQVFKPGTGAKAITANGTYNASDDSLSGYDRVVVNVPSEAVDLGTKTITANGTYTASSDSLDGYSEVTVNVPNSYTASDEGKVVSNGALVSQTSDTATANGTVDTTLINSLTVNVPTGGGGTDYGTTSTNTLSEMFYAIEHSLHHSGVVTVSSYFPANTESLFCDTGFPDTVRGMVIFDEAVPSQTTNSESLYEAIGFFGLPSTSGADQSISSASSATKFRNNVANAFLRRMSSVRMNSGKLYITPQYAQTTYTIFQVGHTYRWIAWPYTS